MSRSIRCNHRPCRAPVLEYDAIAGLGAADGLFFCSEECHARERSARTPSPPMRRPPRWRPFFGPVSSVDAMHAAWNDDGRRERWFSASMRDRGPTGGWHLDVDRVSRGVFVVFYGPSYLGTYYGEAEALAQVRRLGFEAGCLVAVDRFSGDAVELCDEWTRGEPIEPEARAQDSALRFHLEGPQTMAGAGPDRWSPE